MSMEALAAAASNAALNYAAADLSSADNLKRSKEYFDYTLPKNQQAQMDMIRMSPVQMVRGYKQAGLNPASISSSYEGSGATGESGSFDPHYQNTALQDYLSAQQMLLDQQSVKSQIDKTNAETENINKQNEWFDRVKESEISVQNAQQELLKNQSQEIRDLLPNKIKEQTKNLNLLDLNISYQKLQNDAMNSYYDFDGKKIQGKDIPNFQTLFALEMSKKTLAVDWYNAVTQREGIERDPIGVLTKEWFAPLVKALSDDVQGMTPEIKEIFSQNVQKIKQTLSDLGGSSEESDMPSLSDVVSNPYGSSKKILSDIWNNTQMAKDIEKTRNFFKSFTSRLKENTKNGKYW